MDVKNGKREIEKVTKNILRTSAVVVSVILCFSGLASESYESITTVNSIIGFLEYSAVATTFFFGFSFQDYYTHTFVHVLYTLLVGVHDIK